MEYVKWIDSGFSLRSDIWQNVEDIIDLLKDNKTVETVGFKVYEDLDWLVLVQSINETDDGSLYRGGYFIYKKNIVERKALE